MMLRRLGQGAFALFLLLLLGSHAPDSGGPFAWLPLPTAVSWLGWRVGPLVLLPFLVVLFWVADWLPQQRKAKAERSGPSANRPAWSWGKTAVAVPAALFSFWLLARLTVETAHLAAMLGLFWLVYLFLVNHRRWRRENLWLVLTLVLLLQGSVGVAQFLIQKELGLAWLGEPPLDLLVEGTSVAQRDGQNWLRAYGLNSHPNQLGLLLMALCLLIWPNRPPGSGWKPLLLWVGLAAGVAGLWVSLSRTAGLGLLLGGLVLVLQSRDKSSLPHREVALPLAALAAGLLLLTLAYGDVLAGRLLALDTEIESRSLWERQRDLSISWQLLRQQPLLGAGPGQYLVQAADLNPEAAQVHNVLLLVAVELGLPGLGLWLLFWFWPLWRFRRRLAQRPATAVWLGLIFFALLHPVPTLFLPKGAALWGLAAAQWSGP